MGQATILAFAGSTRRESFNRRALKIAVAGAESAGAQVRLIDLAEYPLPLFNQDAEQEDGTPENAKRLKQLFIDHAGLLLACPEYNSSITPLLKNTIDWVSRPAPGEPSLVAYKGKVATLLSASPGALGGLRGLAHVRAILGNIGVIVLPDQIAVGQAAQAFNPDGSLKDAKFHAAVGELGAGLARYLSR